MATQNRLAQIDFAQLIMKQLSQQYEVIPMAKLHAGNPKPTKIIQYLLASRAFCQKNSKQILASIAGVLLLYVLKRELSKKLNKEHFLALIKSFKDLPKSIPQGLLMKIGFLIALKAITFSHEDRIGFAKLFGAGMTVGTISGLLRGNGKQSLALGLNGAFSTVIVDQILRIQNPFVKLTAFACQAMVVLLAKSTIKNSQILCDASGSLVGTCLNFLSLADNASSFDLQDNSFTIAFQV